MIKGGTLMELSWMHPVVFAVIFGLVFSVVWILVRRRMSR
jgi:hypothetical protein